MTAARDIQALADAAFVNWRSGRPYRGATARDELGFRDGYAAALASRLQEQAGQPAPIAWEATTSAYIQYITQERYSRFGPAVQRWYKPYRCSSCATLAAGSQAVQVPGWRPIDSAPKDGSQIDVWIGDEREPDVFWGTPKLGHRAPCWCRYVYVSCFGWIPESVGMPSHWIPKPLQPLAGGEVAS